MNIPRNLVLSFVLVMTAVLQLAGCARVISKEVLQEVDTTASFAHISKDPEASTGKTVLLGGVVVKTLN